MDVFAGAVSGPGLKVGAVAPTGPDPLIVERQKRRQALLEGNFDDELLAGINLGSVTHHQHAHDVAVLSDWMAPLDKDPLEIKKADLVADALIDFVVAKSSQYNSFFNELVRQAAVHCPKVGRLLAKVWIGTFALLDRSTVAYERQLRASQKMRAKMVRMLEHTKTKLDNYKLENDSLKDRYEEKEAECVDLKVTIAGLQRELSALQIENDKLMARIRDSMRAGGGDTDDEGHTLDWMGSEFDISLDAMDAERRRQLKFIHDQDRVSQRSVHEQRCTSRWFECAGPF